MQTQVNPIPQGYHSITPYLIVKDAKKALEFYQKAFGAKEIYRMETPNGMIGHCEFQIGDSKIMMADEFPDMGAKAPASEGGKPFSLLIYVENVDQVFDRAVKAGAKVLRPLKNEFYGDRMGTLQDPFGHNWNLGMHVEDVSPEEMKIRAEKMWSQKPVQ
jgi:PhnB protein